MLGMSNKGNNWKLVFANFLVMVAVQVIFELYGMLALNRFPDPYELYKIVITSLAVTLVFYGYNKRTEPKKEVDKEKEIKDAT